ncbi:hypothetical protein CDL15_Pgr004997 [Punica granatum]|uniref:Uncharacterized protein n=1 Tax=Punica granatum TaxID=22663 RepID=A0A218WRN9_PUNGR|nr:hypothetical protein CDL15_Pgr004997 [Punica granatum]
MSRPRDERFCFAGCCVLKDFAFAGCCAMRDFAFAGCCAMRNSSSRVERLRIPSGRESLSAEVLAACSTCDPGITSKSREKY